MLERASELLEFAPVTEWLRECYSPKGSARPSMALAFGRLIARIFADQGLIVMDAASRGFHALGPGLCGMRLTMRMSCRRR